MFKFNGISTISYLLLLCCIMIAGAVEANATNEKKELTKPQYIIQVKKEGCGRIYPSTDWKTTE